MRQLWAPWRMAYIQDDGERPAGCIFCVKAAEDRDDENLIILRSKSAMRFSTFSPTTTDTS